MTDRELIRFFALAEKMKCNTRHSWTTSGRAESVAEHSWQLALLALLLEDEIEGVDFDRVIRMCLIHDLGEAVTGDVPSFLKTDTHRKEEDKAVQSVLDMLPEPQRGKLSALFSEMEAKETPEAKIYKALDRLEAVLQHNEADIKTWLPLEYHLQQTYGQAEAECHPRVHALRQTALQDTLEKIQRAGGMPSE